VPHITIILLPLILLPLVLLIMGISWFLAALGVYLRDVAQIVGVSTTVLMFLTPIFYPVSAIPEKYRVFIYVSPLTFIIEQARALLIFGREPAWPDLVLFMFLTFFVAWMGFAWFQKTRKGFADVL
jgi:lipopolysaccharide transport system permease protein